MYRVFRSRWLQAVPQLAMVGILGALLYAGLFGSRVANVTPVAVWTLWWGGLIFAVLFLGLFSMARGGEFNKKYGNRLMRLRVVMQGAALVLLALAMLTSAD